MFEQDLCNLWLGEVGCVFPQQLKPISELFDGIGGIDDCAGFIPSRVLLVQAKTID
ncbi:hypothetical protein D3C72_2293650 [compost metagenome]